MSFKINSNKTLKRFLGEEFSKIRSTENTTDASEYFGQIGSTVSEDIPYNIQLETKLKAIKKIFDTNQTPKDLEIAPSPETSEYRFRMDFVCSYDPIVEPHNRFGQRQAKKFHRVVDMHSNVLMNEEWFQKTRKIYEFLHNADLVNYDLVKKTGNLRYLVVRNYKSNSMLNIVTKLKDKFTQDIIEKAAKLAIEQGFESVNWIYQPSESDFSEGEVIKQFGNKSLSVELEISKQNLKFKIGPQSFFQNNIEGFIKLIEYVNNLVEKHNINTEYLYDLYSGIGTIGIILSKNFEKVIGIEIEENNVDMTRENLELNKVNNYNFLQADLNNSELELDIYESQTVIVDPPRNGLEKNGVEHIKKLKPKYLIYISCNPVTQKRDIDMLEDFKVVEMKTFDLFPHTYHMENVMLLRSNY